MLESVPTTTSANVIRQVKPLLEKQIDKATQIAEDRAQDLRVKATQRLSNELGAERDRLVYLRSVNPAVRAAEIEALDQRLEASHRVIADARISIQALRVVVAT